MTLLNTPSGTREPPPTIPLISQTPQNQAPEPQGGLAAPLGGLAAATGPWLPQQRAQANLAQRPLVLEPLQGAGQGKVGKSAQLAPRAPPMPPIPMPFWQWV